MFLDQNIPSKPTHETKPPNAFNALTKFAWPWGFLIFLLFNIVRYAWVASLNDYGFMYDLGARLNEGQAPYRDFITTLPPLTFYSMSLFLKCFQGHVIATSAHQFAWWLASIVCAWRLCLCLGIRDRTALAALITSLSIVSLPFQGHSPYNHAAPVFLCLLFICWLKVNNTPPAQTGHRNLFGFLAGLTCGLLLFVRQNIFIGITPAMVFIFVCGLLLHKKNRAAYLRLAAWFALGWLAGVLIPFGYFAYGASSREVFFQLLADGGASKGGFRSVLGNTWPKIRLSLFMPETPKNKLLENVLGLLMNLSFVGFLLLKSCRKKTEPLLGRKPAWSPLFLLGIALAIYIGIGLWSLLPAPDWAPWLAVSYPVGVIAQSAWSQVLYLILSGIGISSLVLYYRDKDLLPIGIFMCACLAAANMTSPNYPLYAAPAVFPLAYVLIKQLLGERSGVLFFALIALATAILFQCVFNFNVLGFQKTVVIQNTPHWNGIIADEKRAKLIELLAGKVSPIIRSQPVVWATSLGVGGASFGGKSAQGIAHYYLFAYSSRVEPMLEKMWLESPPSFFVLSPYPPTANAIFTSPEHLREWLSKGYDVVWEAPEFEYALWQRRTPSSQIKPCQSSGNP